VRGPHSRREQFCTVLREEIDETQFRFAKYRVDLRETPVGNYLVAMDRLRPDSDVIRRAQQGDADAFAALFHAHKARIYSVCLRMTNNPSEAEDFTQEAFLQAFRKMASFRGDSAFTTWLHRIAVNTILMRFRKKSICQVPLDEPYCNSNGDKIHREHGTKDNRLSGCLDRVSLAWALKELPQGYRAIFLLHEVVGYQHQEIAKLRGCSVGNSKSQLYKAKQRIRELLTCSPETRCTAIRSDELCAKYAGTPLVATQSASKHASI
jgi:RNA polymerase sigma-70 factor (ECF subfamily)